MRSPWRCGSTMRRAVEQHDLAAERLEIVLDLEILDGRAARQQLFEQLAQPRDVPLAVADLVDEPAQHVVRRDREGAVERAVGAFDAQVLVEHQQRLAHRVDGALGDFVGHDGGRLGALEGVDVEQHQHRAVDPVVEREVGAHAQRVPAAGAVANVALLLAHRSDHLGRQGLQVERLRSPLGRCRRRLSDEAVPHMAERPPDVGGEQVELLFGLRAEAPDRQVAPGQHDGEPGRALQVDEVAVDPVELDVAAGHLLVGR